MPLTPGVGRSHKISLHHAAGEGVIDLSVSWGVVPAQPEEPGFQEWLSGEGIEVPNLGGRHPTLEELLKVLETFEGLPVHKVERGDSSYDISLGQRDSEQYALMIGSVLSDGLYDFHFFGSGCQATTMMQIIKKLSYFCGPIVLYENIAATPVLIDHSTDLEQAIEDWRRRMERRHSEHTPR